jgi:hypothetical protein
VPRERCLSCHNREGDFAKISDHVFMHEKHVTEHKVDCLQCHTPILHDKDPQKLQHAVADCQSCHPSHHADQVNILEGAGTKTITGQSNMMLAARIECRTCHRVTADTPTGPVMRGSYEVCAMCHDSGTVEQFKTYHVALRSALPALRTSLGKLDAAAKVAPKERAEKLSVEAGNIRHDLDLLTIGNEVHNMHNATRIVEELLDRLKALCREWKIEEPKVTLPPPLKQALTSTRIDAAKAAPAKELAK